MADNYNLEIMAGLLVGFLMGVLGIIVIWGSVTPAEIDINKFIRCQQSCGDELKTVNTKGTCNCGNRQLTWSNDNNE